MTAEQGKKMRAERKHVMAVKDYQQRFQELRARRRGGVDDGRVTKLWVITKILALSPCR